MKDFMYSYKCSLIIKVFEKITIFELCKEIPSLVVTLLYFEYMCCVSVQDVKTSVKMNQSKLSAISKINNVMCKILKVIN